MKNIIFSLLLFLTACGNAPKEYSQQSAKTSVTVTNAYMGTIDNDEEITATTVYIKKITISAPIAAFIISNNVQCGSIVKKGETLYTLESKEHNALKGTSSSSDMGVIKVKANIDGIVTSIMQDNGNFVEEGAALCTIADRRSLYFELNVPYELSQYAKTGRSCTLVLPNNSKVTATIKRPLISMNTSSQVQQVLASCKTEFLPEGLNVRAFLKTSSDKSQKLIIDKKAIQSDETLTSFWIMKLKNDTTAVKVPIQIGNSNDRFTEITSGDVNISDRIILTGGYALEDNATVTVTK